MHTTDLYTLIRRLPYSPDAHRASRFLLTGQARRCRALERIKKVLASQTVELRPTLRCACGAECEPVWPGESVLCVNYSRKHRRFVEEK